MNVNRRRNVCVKAECVVREEEGGGTTYISHRGTTQQHGPTIQSTRAVVPTLLKTAEMNLGCVRELLRV